MPPTQATSRAHRQCPTREKLAGGGFATAPVNTNVLGGVPADTSVIPVDVTVEEMMLLDDRPKVPVASPPFAEGYILA
jgi:hypothetical protein